MTQEENYFIWIKMEKNSINEVFESQKEKNF